MKLVVCKNNLGAKFLHSKKYSFSKHNSLGAKPGFLGKFCLIFFFAKFRSKIGKNLEHRNLDDRVRDSDGNNLFSDYMVGDKNAELRQIPMLDFLQNRKNKNIDLEHIWKDFGNMDNAIRFQRRDSFESGSILENGFRLFFGNFGRKNGEIF